MRLAQAKGWVPRLAASSLFVSIGATVIGQRLLASGADEWRVGTAYSIGLVSFVAFVAIQTHTSSARAQPLTVARAALVAPLLSALLMGACLLTLEAPHLGGLSITLWAGSLACLVVSGIEHPIGLPQLFARARAALAARSALSVNTVSAAVILLCGAGVRLYQLGQFPSGIHEDEAGQALVSLAVLHGTGPSPFGIGFQADPALVDYFEAAFLGVFGSGIVAARLIAALAGIAALVLFFAFMRHLFGMRPALLATLLLAGCASQVNFSRLALSFAEVPLLNCASLYLAWCAQRRQRPVYWLATGVCAGVACYFWLGGQFSVGLIGLYLAYLLFSRPRQWRAWLAGGLRAAIGVLLALLPMLYDLRNQPLVFISHPDSRLIFNNWAAVSSQLHTNSVLGVIWGQLRLNVLAFFAGGDASDFYTFARSPLIAPMLGSLVALGLVYVLLRARDERYALLAIWFWGTIWVPGVLTVGAPQFHRIGAAVLPALAGVALVLDWLVEEIPRVVGLQLGRVVLLGAVAIAVAAGAIDLHNYFGPAAAARPWSPTTFQAQYVAALGARYRVYTLGTPALYYSDPVRQFLAPAVPGDSMHNPGVDLPVAVPPDHDLAFLLFGFQPDYLPLLQQIYPNGTVQPYPDGTNPVLTAYKVTRDEVRAQQGLTAHYAALSHVESDASSLGGGSATYPVDASWTGSLYVSKQGAYAFETSDRSARLAIDGGDVPNTGQVALTAGWHALAAEDVLASDSSRLKVSWRMPGQASFVPIPSYLLNVGNVAGGLTERLEPQGRPSITRQVQTIAYRELHTAWGIDAPATAGWSGTLWITTPGQYHFALGSTGPAVFAVDGQTVAQNSGPSGYQRNSGAGIDLTAGAHPLSLTFHWLNGNGIVETLWTPPGGKEVIIPPEAFEGRSG